MLPVRYPIFLLFFHHFHKLSFKGAIPLKKVILLIAVLVAVIVAAVVFVLPKGMPAQPSASIEPPAQFSLRPSVEPTATPSPTPKPELTPTPTPRPSDIPTPTPVPDLPPAKEPVIDASETSNGVLIVRYQTSEMIKVLISKDGSSYNYNLPGDNMPVRYPLNMGQGEYQVQVLEHVSGTRYRPILSETIAAQWDDENVPYLQSIQLIRWDPSMKPILDAFRIAAEAGDEGKVREIYKELADTLVYNYDLLNKLPTSYLPNIEETYSTRLGICYDFSSLFASMLRSVDVPVRLHMGFSSLISGPHAWNEVLVGDQWIVVDLTVDASYRESGDKYTFEKDPSQYSSNKTY